jgi:hypothetical protein
MPKSVTALIPSWLTCFRILVASIVLLFLLEFLWPNADLSISAAHLGVLIGSVALILCSLTFWSKARVEIGRRKFRYKTVRINAGIVAPSGSPSSSFRSSRLGCGIRPNKFAPLLSKRQPAGP